MPLLSRLGLIKYIDSTYIIENNVTGSSRDEMKSVDPFGEWSAMRMSCICGYMY
jgi:hypothetical protein